MIIYESKGAAKVASEQVASMAPDAVTLDVVEVRETLASA